MLRLALPYIPTMNRKGEKKAKNLRQLEKVLAENYQIKKGNPRFRQPTKLKAFFSYFCCDKIEVASDIHNVMKPFIDDLEGFVLENDKQIVSFFGNRLDMHTYQDVFEYEIELDGMDEKTLQKMLNAQKETVCLIEIDEVYSDEQSAVKIKWLGSKDE